MIKVGVFDSGIGGLSVAHAITERFPDVEVIFKNDSVHVPYGNKPKDELLSFVVPILETIVQDGCSVIVIACNTITTLMIKELRELFPVPLIGMEPMVKPAVEMTKSGVIAVCATPQTLASERYSYLKQTYANGVTVLEPDCSDWSFMIETNKVDKAKIEDITKDVISQGADVIVLGCTHYHWIEEDIKSFSKGAAQVLQPEVPVLDQLERVLATLRP